MIKQLRKVGNSNALLLDKPVLELLGLKEDSHVQLTIQDGVLIMSPVNPQQVDQEKFQQALDKVMAQRSKVLERLAQ
jgi:antitoxin MazE